MIKTAFLNLFDRSRYFSRIILLQLLIIFGWWRLWRISPEYIHVSPFNILDESPYYVYLWIYTCLFFAGIFFVKTQKYFYLVIYSLLLLFSMIMDVFTYHHGEFTLVVIVLHHLLSLKFKLKENYLIAGLYLLCLIPKINGEFISGAVTDNLLARLNIGLNLGYIGGLGALIFEFCAVILFINPKNKLISKFSLPLILFHAFMGLVLMRGVLFNYLFIVMISKYFSKYKLADIIYFVLAGSIMFLKIVYFKFF